MRDGWENVKLYQSGCREVGGFKLLRLVREFKETYIYMILLSRNRLRICVFL